MAERASVPTFVPRTVASVERAATAVARRVAAPVRMLATRALSFADRLVGTWTGATPTVGGFESGARPAMRTSTRGSAMLLPRPWYEVDADEDAIWPQQAAIAAQQAAIAAQQASVAAQIARAATATLPSAERGAAIARTTLTAPEATSARAVTPPASTTADPGTATSGAQQIAAAATADVRVAEALGLRTPIAAAQPIAATPVA